MAMVFDNYIVGTFLVSLSTFLFLLVLRRNNNNREKKSEKVSSRQLKIKTDAVNGTSSGECSSESGFGDDVIIVGAGVAGAALAHTLGKDGRRVHVIERDLTEPDRIVGELLQPGGYLKLVELGLEDCVEEIDAQRVLGYALFKDGRHTRLSYPLEKFCADVSGRSFHNGRFIQRMREKAATLPNVRLEQGTVTSLLEEKGIIRGVQYKTKDGEELRAYAPLTIVCDGCFSNLRRSLCNPKVDVPSCFVASLTSYLESFYTLRKPVASTINTLAGALYKVFSASPDEARKEMRQACFDYLSLGVGRLMLPFPSLKRMWIGARLISSASGIIFPIIKGEGISHFFSPSVKNNMSRRQVSVTRRFVDSGNFPFSSALHSKSRSSPILSIGLVIVGAVLIIGYVYSGSGKSRIDGVSRLQGEYTCTLEVQRAIPFLQKAYGDNMHKVLHVGPDTCSVVSKLLKEEGTEAWGVEPYDIEDVEADCKTLVGKGIVRVADIKFPLPYRSKSFSLVIVSDAVDYLSPKYLNKTLPEFARVASDGLLIFAGFPGQQKAKGAGLSKFGRPAKMRSSTWWVGVFGQNSLEANEAASKKFEQAASKGSYLPTCQVFHLKPYH
ncbi:hypothetical protein V6N13_043887 [Hibiscus sabdariffa]